jgi:hypothetical protein
MLWAIIYVFSFSASQSVLADAYYFKDSENLDFTEGKNPIRRANLWSYPRRPQIVIEGAGEAYAILRGGKTEIAIRVATPRKIKGRVCLWSTYYDGDSDVLHFTIDQNDSRAAHRRAFLETKLTYYQHRLNEDIPGAAWFRHQVREIKKELGMNPTGDERGRPEASWRRDGLESTYDLFSGGRAVSENLQLDREMPVGPAGTPTVAIGSIPGITVREFDWKPLVKGLKPKTDALAAIVPFDQHAVFFPSFQAMVQLADYVDQHGAPILHAAEPRSEDAQIRKRYERQLCLPTTTLGRLLGPRLIRSLAVTGGDPYLRTGSDVAILFEAKNVEALRAALDVQVATRSALYKSAKPIKGEINGVAYTGARSPDRVICSYVATLGDNVVVTNSPAQLARLIDVHQGKRESLATLDEYTYFRDRYARSTQNEVALVVLSDATIRRWCGPKWRIANSRQTRAAAVMSDLQAVHFDKLVSGKVQLGPLVTNRPLVGGGEMLLAPSGVRSEVYGHLAFQTPIMEKSFTHVTKRERLMYGRWRDGYQSNWSNFFDPIAIQLRMDKSKIAGDLTVMPLIGNSEYNTFIDITKGAKITAHAGDSHAGSLAHYVMAFDTDSEFVKTQSRYLQGFIAPKLKINPLSWMGESISVYIDDGPFWKEMAKAEKPERFLEQNYYRLPLAVHFEVKSVFHLTAFLTGFRAFVEQTSPDLTIWETKEHNGVSYVKVGPAPAARSNSELDNTRIYYAASADGLTVTLNEKILHRALDRRAARKEAKADRAKPDGKKFAAKVKPWLGQHLCVQANQSLIYLLGHLGANDYQREMQRIAWSNLPILNEWKRRYPKADPVALHAKHWHIRLVCPGGGKYQWNDEWKTMESTVYGHPGEPKKGPSLPGALQTVKWANFGLTFEEHGLRAQAELGQ